jgi:2-polyprenyl-3-methyl-5-hydroxy-6-metoxy-1,4-benzoquinol methylase
MSVRCPSCGWESRPFRLPLERATLDLCETCGHGVTVECSRPKGLACYAAGERERQEFERCYLPARLRSYERGLALLGPAEGRRLLDFGSNYGDFLVFATARGWHAVGVEPGAALREQAVDGTGATTVGTLDDARDLGPFDVITLWDVFEHLPSPETYLETFAGLLAAEGRLLLRVPDARVFQVLRSRWSWRAVQQAYLTICHPTNPEEHVSHFTPRSLATVASRAGFAERARLEARFDERVVSGRTAIDFALRRGLHFAGRHLPYEFTMALAPAGAR